MLRIFRNNNDWLRYRTKVYLKEKHPSLYDSKSTAIRKKCLNYISDKKQWWLILLFVVAVFLISSFINFGDFNFIKLETTKNLVDQRTSNIASIISITLVVVGFLITNLAIKSPITYTLLFQKSYMYPTLYLVLSTIAYFTILSSSRDSVNEKFHFSQAVLAGTILVFFILILIGKLFNVIIQYANGKNVKSLLEDQLLIEAKNNIKDFLLRRYSGEQYISHLQKNGASEYNLFEDFNFNNARPIDANEKKNKNKILFDVNLDRIEFFLEFKCNKSSIRFKKLELGVYTEERNNFIWSREKANSWINRLTLYSCLIFKKDPKIKNDVYMYRKYFDDQIVILTEENKYRELDEILKSYEKLYTLEIQNQL